MWIWRQWRDPGRRPQRHRHSRHRVLERGGNRPRPSTTRSSPPSPADGVPWHHWGAGRLRQRFHRDRMLTLSCRTRICCTCAITATCFHQDDYAASWTSRAPGQGRTRCAMPSRQPLIKADTVKIFPRRACWKGSLHHALPANAGMLENHLQSPSPWTPPAARVSIRTAGRGQQRHRQLPGGGSARATSRRWMGWFWHPHAASAIAAQVALDALEAARASRQGTAASPPWLTCGWCIPDDQKRLGELGLYLTFTMPGPPQLALRHAGQPLHPARQVGTVPDRGHLRPPYGLSHGALYPVESSARLGAVLVAGSDAPVDSRGSAPVRRTWPPA